MDTVDEVIEVAAPLSRVWSRWADVERLPDFMEGTTRVRCTADDRLEWRGVLDGEEVEWVGRITAWEPERLIAWSSEEGVAEAGGRVELTEAGEGDAPACT